MSESFIQETRPVFFEGLIVILLGIIIIWNLTATDINFHGNYVGFIIKYCHEQNVEKMCVEFREHLKIAPNTQMELGNAYWQDLARQGITIGFTMGAIRFAFSWLLHIAHVQKIRPSSYMMAFLYAFIGYGLFLFGVLDTLYYVFQAQALPTDLEWLNHAGVFEWSKTWTGTKDNVEVADLLLTNASCFLIIGVALLLTMTLFKESGVKRAIA